MNFLDRAERKRICWLSKRSEAVAEACRFLVSYIRDRGYGLCGSIFYSLRTVVVGEGGWVPFYLTYEFLGNILYSDEL